MAHVSADVVLTVNSVRREIIRDFQIRVKWVTEGAAFVMLTVSSLGGLHHHYKRAA